jgi:SAM-dependent methyltransferase
MIGRLLEWPLVYELSQRNVLTAGMRREILALLRREGADGTAERVLEVGCGTGLYLSALDPGVFGTDISVPYVRFLHGRGRRVFASDARALPIRTGSVDLVYCVNVLHHLDDASVGSVLREMWRVCRPGGAVVAVDIVHARRGNRLGRLLRRLDRGGFVRQREQFADLIRTWAGVAAEDVAFTDLHAYPQDALIGIVRKWGVGRV